MFTCVLYNPLKYVLWIPLYNGIKGLDVAHLHFFLWNQWYKWHHEMRFLLCPLTNCIFQLAFFGLLYSKVYQFNDSMLPLDSHHPWLLRKVSLQSSVKEAEDLPGGGLWRWSKGTMASVMMQDASKKQRKVEVCLIHDKVWQVHKSSEYTTWILVNLKWDNLDTLETCPRDPNVARKPAVCGNGACGKRFVKSNGRSPIATLCPLTRLMKFCTKCFFVFFVEGGCEWLLGSINACVRKRKIS